LLVPTDQASATLVHRKEFWAVNGDTKSDLNNPFIS
jgi:hypothetical protein